MAEVQNSNPTILNAADLPSRLRPTATGKTSTYGGGIFTQSLSNASDFFSTSPLSSSESESEDDLMEEPIDEQEIYGETSPPILMYLKSVSFSSTLTLSNESRSDLDDLRP